MPVRNRIAELHREIAGWRQDFHANPELLYDLPRTAGSVARKLRDFGCDEVVEGVGRSGVVGVIHGRSSTGSCRVGLRADMDALPITEQTGLPYSSRNVGKMHACGHDGHTAMLLGAAKYLAETRNFDGRVVLVFQPAEEGGGGATAMIEDGLIERFGITEIYGMHNRPGLEAGHIDVNSGPAWAAADRFELKIRGRGGHAAQPSMAIDPTVAASHILLALQTIVSRNADPLKSLVVSVTALHTDTEAFNIIPELVTMRGSVRSFDADQRRLAEARIRKISAQVADAFDATVEIIWTTRSPAVVNAVAQTAFAVDAARKVTPNVNANAPRMMGTDDFSVLQQAVPGTYLQIGNGDSADLHNPGYNFNDEIIATGCSLLVEIVESRMAAA